MRTALLASLAAVLLCAVGGPLRAAPVFINGGFETTTFHYTDGGGNVIYPGTSWGPYFKNDDGSVAQTVPGWTNYGFNMIFTPDLVGSAVGSPQSPAVLRLWGFPGTGVSNGIGPSPYGGNFLGADGAYLNAPIAQTITGLVVGRQYQVSFAWAAAQLEAYGGATQDAWKICFGVCAFTSVYDNNGDGYSTFNTPGMIPNLATADPNDMIADSTVQTTGMVNVPNHGFVPWQGAYMTFTATSTTQTLSLLSYGTPIGAPPFALLDGLSFGAVPEPSTWAMMLIGFGVIGGVMRTRRQPINGRRALNSQII